MHQSGDFPRDVIVAFRQWRVWGYLALNDLKVRFARSRFGFAWIFISFAVWAAGVGFVYANLFDLNKAEFVPFLAIGFATWGFITGTIVDCAWAFLNAAGYVKQFNRPKQVYVWRVVALQVLSFAMVLVVCFLILAIFGQFTLSGLAWAVPGFILLIAAGSIHAFLFAYLTPFVRDLPHALASGLNVLFFLTPIIFTPQMLAKRGLSGFYAFNPFHYLIEGLRAPMLTGSAPELMTLLGGLAYVVAIGILTFGIVCDRLDRQIVYAL